MAKYGRMWPSGGQGGRRKRKEGGQLLTKEGKERTLKSLGVQRSSLVAKEKLALLLRLAGRNLVLGEEELVNLALDVLGSVGVELFLVLAVAPLEGHGAGGVLSDDGPVGLKLVLQMSVNDERLGYSPGQSSKV